MGKGRRRHRGIKEMGKERMMGYIVFRFVLLCLKYLLPGCVVAVVCVGGTGGYQVSGWYFGRGVVGLILSGVF